MFSPEQINSLNAPLSSAWVKTRKQAGRDLSYIEGWHAIAEANRIFGFDAWNRETVDLAKLGEPREVDGKWRVAFMARVRITVGTVIREGCGYGSGIDRDLGSAHESALKEAETDAMKRALMTFGNPFGLALYDKEQLGVERAPATSEPAPQPQPQNAKAKAAAASFGEDAIVFLRDVKTPQAFDAWHKENRDKVARLREYDATLHSNVMNLVDQCLKEFCTLGVG